MDFCGFLLTFFLFFRSFEPLVQVNQGMRFIGLYQLF